MGWIETSPHRRFPPVCDFYTQRMAEVGIEVMGFYRLGDYLMVLWEDVMVVVDGWFPVVLPTILWDEGDESSYTEKRVTEQPFPWATVNCSFSSHVKAGWKFTTVVGLMGKKYMRWHPVTIREICCRHLQAGGRWSPGLMMNCPVWVGQKSDMK